MGPQMAEKSHCQCVRAHVGLTEPPLPACQEVSFLFAATARVSVRFINVAAVAVWQFHRPLSAPTDFAKMRNVRVYLTLLSIWFSATLLWSHTESVKFIAVFIRFRQNE